jgi:hypothetical protein
MEEDMADVGGANREMQAKLDQLLDQSNSHTGTLNLLSAKLFGSEEDHYTAGRLPLIESRLSGVDLRVSTIETAHAEQKGSAKLLLPMLHWLGLGFIALISSLTTWFIAIKMR